MAERVVESYHNALVRANVDPTTHLKTDRHNPPSREDCHHDRRHEQDLLERGDEPVIDVVELHRHVLH
jgi:hypothetical protein